MRFKEERWQPTIGDKYDIANFNGLTFVWPKERVTAYEEPYKICGVEPYIRRSSSETSLWRSFNKITNAYLGIQVSSKYMIEQYRKSRDK